MQWLLEVLRYTHIVAGFAALVLFWLPAVSRKGGTVHRKSGRAYVTMMLAVVMTAAVLAVARLVAGDWVEGTFLGYLVVITFTALWVGWRALVPQNRRAGLRAEHLVLAWLNLAVALSIVALGVYSGLLLVLLYAPIGLVMGWLLLRSAYRIASVEGYWLRTHFSGMILSGIGAHVAFFAFGASRLFPHWDLQSLGLLPWLLPLAAGVGMILALNVLQTRQVPKEG